MSEAKDWMYPFWPGDRCNIEQYKMLLRCSEKEDITEWYKWRNNNPDKEIWLVGANLQGAELMSAKLQCAHLRRGNLQGAKLGFANLQGADLSDANLQGAILWDTKLQGARLLGAKLQRADLSEANLQGAVLSEADLQDADFEAAMVDGKTYIWNCAIDKKTNFTGVGLDSARVEPGLKQLLKYNIRRKRWQKWYKDHRWLKWPVKRFWCMSDYGRSTGRIVGVFFILAALFAAVYYVCGLICKPGIVANLFEDHQVPVPGWLVPFRAIYFSIVTMTTLGFGDMYAKADSFAGHLLLTLQVLLGYMLLAALVTRFAVLFTAGGPAGEFADEKGLIQRWQDFRAKRRAKKGQANQGK